MQGCKTYGVLLLALLLMTAQGPSVAPQAASAESDPELVEAALGLQRSDIRLIQLGLAAERFDPGPADGMIGRRTRAALGQWQTAHGEASTGYLDTETAKLLITAGKKREAQNQARQEAEERTRWIFAENQRCQLYHSYNPVAGETVTWSGDCVDGKAHGEGRYVWRVNRDIYTYEGQMRAGKRDGKGIYTWADGSRYEGQWRDNRMHGQGTFTWADGTRHVGELRNSNFHGRGIRTWPNGNRYEGEWHDDKMHGQGLWIGSDGEYYLGDYRSGKRHGRGIHFQANGSRYEGEWRDGKAHGQGIMTYSNGDLYEGMFRDYKPHGHGVLTLVNGSRFDGQWRNGCFGKRDGGPRVRIGTSAAACGFE